MNIMKLYNFFNPLVIFCSRDIGKYIP